MQRDGYLVFGVAYVCRTSERQILFLKQNKKETSIFFFFLLLFPPVLLMEHALAFGLQPLKPFQLWCIPLCRAIWIIINGRINQVKKPLSLTFTSTWLFIRSPSLSPSLLDFDYILTRPARTSHSITKERRHSSLLLLLSFFLSSFFSRCKEMRVTRSRRG